jgi:hypothetical protein
MSPDAPESSGKKHDHDVIARAAKEMPDQGQGESSRPNIAELCALIVYRGSFLVPVPSTD